MADSVLSRDLRLDFCCQLRFAEIGMCRVGLVILIVALAAASSSHSRAAESFQIKPALQSVATADVPVPTPPGLEPNAPPSDLPVGCGKGRVRDPQTHLCRGPGDVR